MFKFQTVSDQNVKISNLELVISSQRALITSQAEALKATEAKVEELARRLSENEEKMVGAESSSKKRKSGESSAPAAKRTRMRRGS